MLSGFNIRYLDTLGCACNRKSWWLEHLRVPRAQAEALFPKDSCKGSARSCLTSGSKYIEIPADRSVILGAEPAPPNYPLTDPKYHLIETIRP